MNCVSDLKRPYAVCPYLPVVLLSVHIQQTSVGIVFRVFAATVCRTTPGNAQRAMAKHCQLFPLFVALCLWVLPCLSDLSGNELNAMNDLCDALGTDMNWNCSTNPCPDAGGAPWSHIVCSGDNSSVLGLLEYVWS